MRKELEDMYYYFYNQYLNEDLTLWQWDEVKDTIRKFEYWKTEMEKKNEHH